MLKRLVRAPDTVNFDTSTAPERSFCYDKRLKRRRRRFFSHPSVGAAGPSPTARYFDQPAFPPALCDCDRQTKSPGSPECAWTVFIATFPTIIRIVLEPVPLRFRYPKVEAGKKNSSIVGLSSTSFVNEGRSGRRASHLTNQTVFGGLSRGMRPLPLLAHRPSLLVSKKTIGL